jgi:acetyl-CoA carboxylase biotin carboxylase subunit
MVTGVDLIKWQLKIAGGQNLTLKQRDIEHKGVAIECRINAEDCDRNFAPCPGRVDKFILPGGMGVRVDTHIFQGAMISPNYDSMIAKLIVHKPTREEAVITMKRALNEFRIGPIKTTIPACLKILSHNRYLQNKVDTSFIEQHLA